LFEQNDKFAAKAISASNGDAGKLKAKERGAKSGLGERVTLSGFCDA
jgi:hypothetical protein